MKLKDLQAKLDDKLIMDGVYRSIHSAAVCQEPNVRFVTTKLYPNMSTSYLNQQQAEQLTEDGYTVVLDDETSPPTYVVSGWTL